MYVMILEDGNMVLLQNLTADDLRAADEGYAELIDVSRADDPLRYMDEGWTNIDGPDEQPPNGTKLTGAPHTEHGEANAD